jgi:hypothetical protein
MRALLLIVGLIFTTFTPGIPRAQGPFDDQRWIVGKVPPDFPALQPYGGTPEDHEIIGGHPSEWADLVALRIPTKDGIDDNLCSGVLLREDTILTAAHCLCWERNPIRRAPHVALSESKDLSKQSAWRETADFEFFPGWSCQAMGQVSDLAVVFLIPRLDRGLTNNLIRLNGTRASAPYRNKCRASGAMSWRDTVLELQNLLVKPPSALNVAGFGLDRNGKKGAPLEAKLSITSLACTGKEAHLRWCKPFREMILGGDRRDRGTRDSCGGDSGGPVFWQAPDGKRFLVGVVSRGVPPLLGEPALECGLGGIYTHIGLHDVTNWLQNIGVGPEDVCG